LRKEGAEWKIMRSHTHLDREHPFCLYYKSGLLYRKGGPSGPLIGSDPGFSITNKLQGKPDGSFLVCGSQKEEKYTLLVRKDGAYEIIDICRSRKKYGFFDTLKNKPVLVKFPTIPALVEHFRRVPLTKYNPHLDITLTYPISRFAEVSNQLIGHFTNLLSTGRCCWWR
jgi:hypothetical protein